MRSRETTGKFTIEQVLVHCHYCSAQNRAHVFSDTVTSTIECVNCDRTIEIDVEQKRGMAA